MQFEGNKVTRLCSFYVSDWHLITMILPYINKEINEEAKILTILENDLKENVTKLLNNLNLKNKDEILNIDWNKKEKNKRITTYLKDDSEIVIFVNGSEEFVNKESKKIDKYLETHFVKAKVKIVNCFEITNFKGSITEILKSHDKILNTSGEKEIEEVFNQYEELQRKENAV